MEDYSEVYSVAVLCDCEYDNESYIIGNMCKYCKEKDDIARKNEWYEEIKTIKPLLLKCENTPSNDRIPIIRKLFEYILTRNKFMARNSIFRNSLKNKINEFKLDEKAICLTDIFEKTEIYLEELKNHPEYKI
jgi:hypothetical protein